MILFYLNVITYTQPDYVTRVDPHTSDPLSVHQIVSYLDTIFLNMAST